MYNFIGKSNGWIFCKLRKSEILRLYSIVHVAMETTKMSIFTCQSKSFINIFSTCQVSACELQPFSCHNLANDIYSETAKTVFSHLNCHKLCNHLLLSEVKFSKYWPALDRRTQMNGTIILWRIFFYQILLARRIKNRIP